MKKYRVVKVPKWRSEDVYHAMFKGRIFWRHVEYTHSGAANSGDPREYKSVELAERAIELHKEYISTKREIVKEWEE